MSSIELYVQDVVTRTRRVTIADKCPKCGADLRGPNAIVLEQYEASRAWMTIPEEDDIEWGNWEKRDSKGAEGYIAVGYTCSACGEFLITSSEVKIDVGDDENLQDKTFDLLLYTDRWEQDVLKAVGEAKKVVQ